MRLITELKVTKELISYEKIRKLFPCILSILLLTASIPLSTLRAFAAESTRSTNTAANTAQSVAEQIAALPDEALTLADHEKVKAAYMAFAALTQEQKAQVSEKLIADLKSAKESLDDLLGDVDMDGDIDANDALEALQHSVSLITLGGEAFIAADVDMNDRVDAADALYMLMYSVKIIQQFPAQIEFPVQN